jgi:carboxypeptidase Taq
MSDAWERLFPRLEELRDLASVGSLLSWDQAVMMPPRGGPARAKVISTIDALTHSRLVDPEIGALLEELRGDDSLDELKRAHVRVLAKSYERATKIPEGLVRALSEESGLAYNAWVEARPANDFAAFAPHLEKLLALKKEEADAVGHDGERYDALLDEYEPDMKTTQVEDMFTDLVGGLRPLVEGVLEVAGDKPAFLSAAYEENRQEQFSQTLVRRLGFEMDAGRLDLSPHPFTQTISAGDVRQTTRTEPNTVLNCVYSAIHETGHALYEQGIPEEVLGLPAGNAPSLGIHESQSRMWENQVGRSRAFTDFLLPQLKDVFPQELGRIDPDEFYRGANFPARTLIRVNADELTYNLHLALRFELEVAMVRDELEVAELPDAWREGMQRNLGVVPETDADGVLQDVHWSLGAIGYFPTYTLGTMYAAAFYRKAEEELGDLAPDLRRGDGSRLLGWLRANIHRHGYIYSAGELGERVLGAPLTAAPLLDYLKVKYEEIYGTAL